MPKYHIFTRPRNIGTSFKRVRDHRNGYQPIEVEADSPEAALRSFFDTVCIDAHRKGDSAKSPADLPDGSAEGFAQPID